MTTAPSVRVHTSRGAAAVTIGSGELEATFLPELNLLGTSLRLDDEEFLALPGGVGAYRGGHATGLPLLAPWANRLGARAYRSGRVDVDLEVLPLHVDGNGLPIRGTMSARDAWEIVSLSTRGSRARLHARFDCDRADLLAAFPFPHRLETVIEASGRTLSIVTSLTSTGRRAVPISFGYHPYLRLPRGRRTGWRLHRGARTSSSTSAGSRRADRRRYPRRAVPSVSGRTTTSSSSSEVGGSRSREGVCG